MSAIKDSGDVAEPVQVLITLHQNMNLLDFSGPLEVMYNSLHDLNDPESKAFDITFAGDEEHVMTAQGASLRAHINLKEALKRLKEFDVLVVPGGNVMKIIEEEEHPLQIIQAFSDLQTSDPARERTILAVDTAALFLAKLGMLQGLAATTHPDYYIKIEKLCQEAAAKGSAERTDVMEERYVVNQGRFDLGEDLEENPYVFTKTRRTSSARKGSVARKESNARRESIIRRSTMKLGGMRVITSGGPTSGLDATLYLVSAVVSLDSAQEVSRIMQFTWTKGVVVDAIDV